MKKIIVLIISLVLLTSVLTACNTSGGGTNDNNESNENGVNLVIGANALKFVHNGVSITPNAEAAPIIASLGDPVEYVESPSCGFEGMDKTYKYNGFIIDTVTMKGVEYIYYILLVNDTVETAEGAYINMTPDEVAAIYEGKFKVEGYNVIVAFENGELRFFFKNNVCTSISYSSTTIPNLEEGK